MLPRKPEEFAGLLAWLGELGLTDELPEAVFLEMGAERDTPVDIALIGADDETTAILSAAREAMRLIASRLPAKEFFIASQRRGFPAGAVLSPDEAFDDEHTVARGFRVPVDHPELGTTITYPGTPYVFSETPDRRPGPAAAARRAQCAARRARRAADVSAGHRLTHIGLCVRDIERSSRVLLCCIRIQRGRPDDTSRDPATRAGCSTCPA